MGCFVKRRKITYGSPLPDWKSAFPSFCLVRSTALPSAQIVLASLTFLVATAIPILGARFYLPSGLGQSSLSPPLLCFQKSLACSSSSHQNMEQELAYSIPSSRNEEHILEQADTITTKRNHITAFNMTHNSS